MTTNAEVQDDDTSHTSGDPYTSQRHDTTWTETFTRTTNTAQESGSYADLPGGGREQSGAFTSRHEIETGDNGEIHWFFEKIHQAEAPFVDTKRTTDTVWSRGTTHRLEHSGSYGPAGGDERLKRSGSELDHTEEELLHFVGTGNLSNDHTTRVRDYTAEYPATGQPHGTIDETTHHINEQGQQTLVYQATGDPLGHWTETFYDENTGAFLYSIPYDGATALTPRTHTSRTGPSLPGFLSDGVGFLRDPLDWAFGGGGQQAHLFNYGSLFYSETVGAGVRGTLGDAYLANAGGWELLGVTTGAVTAGVLSGVGGTALAGKLGAGGLGGSLLGGALGGGADYAASQGLARAGSAINNGGQVADFSAIALAENMAAGAATAGVLHGIGAGAKAVVGKFGKPLAVRVSEIHEILDPIARAQRTTAMLETGDGIRIVGSGIRDLTPAQRAALVAGEVPARLPGAHAEVTVLQHAIENGLTPRALVASRAICDECAAIIADLGGKLTNPFSAIW